MKKIIIGIIIIVLVGVVVYFQLSQELEELDERCFQSGESVPKDISPGKSTCTGMFSSYQYDNDQNKCITVGISGCSVKSPFGSLEECKNICER